MSFPFYTLDAERAPPLPYGQSRRDVRGARDPQRGACIPPMRVPIYKVVLRKEGTLRVPRTRIDTPAAAHEVAYALIGDRPFEHAVAMFINSAAEITGAIIIGTSSSVGTSPITVRGVFTGAIVHNATAIILAHNHPSGDPRPSDDDLRVTERMREAAEILGIPVVDHLIITRDPTRWRSITCP